MSERRLRIFISSPGDVQDERNRARDVVHQLRRLYAGRLDLQALLWEELPLQADMSFQQGIDMVLSKTGVDIAIFILWSRLGSPTGPLMVGDEGRQYRSGTEREWDLMLRARERCLQEGKPLRPTIIVYTRQDEVSFEERLRGKPDEEKAEQISQKQSVTEFIKEEFRDADSGVNIRAYHSFDQPTTFARQLRIHLTNLLDPLAGHDMGQPVWSIEEHGPPFRGLDVFEYQHAPIFFGREDEIVSIRTRLREQACRGCAFVLISGPSGSGKSSLARAGVLPDVRGYETDSEIQQWRSLALTPNQLGTDLLGGLVKLLTAEGVLPELKRWADDIAPPEDSESMRDWLTRLALRTGDALQLVGGRRGAARLILLVDQLEELFSDRSVSEESREHLFEALEVLARSGSVWVLATVRGDFYHHCQSLSALVRMKDGAGQYDLLPPTPDALWRLITGPALLAGFRFEREGEQTLADAILRDAVEHKELLPLVEHLLLELCQHRSEEGMLSFAEFRRLGGVEGALHQRCEETFDQLSPATQASLEVVLSELVTLSGDGQEAVVRRTVLLGRFADHPAQRELINAMVAARLFTTARGPEAESVVSVAHEALLRVWPRVRDWIIRNREHLRLRARVEQSRQRWEQQGQDDSLLLPIGLPLNEARQLQGEASHLLSFATTAYIETSIRFHDERARQVRRSRRIIAAVSLALLSIGGWFAWETRGRLRAEGAVQAIYAATPAELEKIIQGELPPLRRWADKSLQGVANDPSAPADQRLRASLAALPTDPSQVHYLEQRLLACSFDEFPVIRNALKNSLGSDESRMLIGKLWECLRNPRENMERRFRAGMALAEFVAGSVEWTDDDTRLLTEVLLTSNPDYQRQLRDYLMPIGARLGPHLETAFQNEGEHEPVRLAAANALGQFWADDVGSVVRLLTVATAEQFAVLYPPFAASPLPGIEDLGQIAVALPPEEMGSVERVHFGKRRANAAVTLLRLGELEKVLPVFDMTDDPEALTQFIFRCRDRVVRAEALLDLLEIVTHRVSEGSVPREDIEKLRSNARTRYALLLALGEYELEEIPESRRVTLLNEVANWYLHDPSSAVHGAAGWLLRQWGADDIAREVDQTPVPYSPDREWFTLAIEIKPEVEGGVLGLFRGRPQPKKFFFTFIVFPEGEYMIGSVEDEPDRAVQAGMEQRHGVKLTRPFALLDREITFEELIAFSPQKFTGFMQQFNAEPVDAGFGADWYDSVSFCRWLGAQMGLPEAHQAYANPESLDMDEYPREPNPDANWAPRNWPLDLGRRGFRLPTESEWEVATRAGTRTSYGYGSDVTLLDRFGWFMENSGKRVHRPRELRPNLRGLFDLHGNLFNWTHDRFGDFGSATITDPLGAEGGSDRVYRGGGWDNLAAYCRTAYRGANQPSNRNRHLGFRVALSPSAEPPEAEQDQ